MEPGTNRPVVRSALEEAICSGPDMIFPVAFGSRFSDTSRHSSDLDITVKFTTNLPERERFEKRCFQSGNL